MENYKFIILMIIVDIIILIISEILMKKYLKRKMLFPKTRLIKGSGVTNDDLDINNSVFLHMTDGIIAFDRNGVVILINPAAKQMMNISPQDTTFEDIFGRLHINLEKIIYLENWTNTEERISIDDRFLNVYFAPFKKDNDKTVGVIAVLQDITEHVKLDNMRKEFIADVSHELKTPIALIQGYSEGLLENVNTDEESRKFYAEVILDEATKMDKMVRQLIELTKLEYENREFNNRNFNIVELEKEICRSSKVMLEEKGVNVEFETSDVINVYADDFYISQCITNYLTNAIKHVEKVDGEKVIKITNTIIKDKARITVFNTGENIEKENLSRIWNRFFKVDESRNREDGGSGIGLSIVKAIMNNYGNDFGVENKPNGVEFYFDIDLERKDKN